MERPDVLVLGAGGTVGAAWMGGVLAGLAAETGIDFATVEHLVGTSAGSIVAADLLAGEEPRGLADGEPAELPATLDDPAAVAAGNGALRARAGRFGAGLASAAGSSLAPLALSLGRAPGTLVRAAALARVEPPEATLDDLGARIAGHGLQWDGRLRVVCVDRERGRRVVFGAPGAPDATIAQAVQASCSIPWAYRPVLIGGDEYVDGAVWSPTNMDVAPGGRETHMLCLAPMAGHLGTRERSAAVRAATTAAIGIETATLRRRGAHVTLVAPEPGDPGEHVRAAGFRQGRALARAAGSARSQ
ncbi:MAG TPA: patatin-like phospholipase family protein [Conexibacter sp.]|nr:patatin-like phospholipase family protein [Conexibacter sp.]